MNREAGIRLQGGADVAVRGNDIRRIDVHRGVSTEPDREVTRLQFDRAYARRPRLAFGRVAGTVQEGSFLADGDSTYVGTERAVDGEEATFDVTVEEP